MHNSYIKVISNYDFIISSIFSDLNLKWLVSNSAINDTPWLDIKDNIISITSCKYILKALIESNLAFHITLHVESNIAATHS